MTTRTTLPLPSIADVLGELNADEPGTVVLISRADVWPGPPDGIAWDDPAHLAQLAARNAEIRRAQRVLEIVGAVIILTALVWLALIGGPDILLGN